MTREIFREEDDEHGIGLIINTFWGGSDRKTCVQITPSTLMMLTGYTQITREHAIHFFKTVLKRLQKQVKEDAHDPPWSQQLMKKWETELLKGMKAD